MAEVARTLAAAAGVSYVSVGWRGQVITVSEKKCGENIHYPIPAQDFTELIFADHLDIEEENVTLREVYPRQLNKGKLSLNIYICIVKITN